MKLSFVKVNLKKEISRFIGVLSGVLIYVTLATTVSAVSEIANSQIISPLADNIASESSNINLANIFNQTEPTVEKEPDLIEDDCNLSNVFTPEVLRWKNKICGWSVEHQMDANIIATIMQIESCGDPSAVSATGVRGLFQVTGANLDGENPFDPNVSMAKGPGKVLKNELIASDNHVVSALAGYNGGGYARQYIKGDISRSQFYSFLVNHPSGYWRTRAKALAKINEVEHYAQWANIYEEAKIGDNTTVNKWLEAGGQRLCDSSKLVSIDSHLLALN